MSKLANDYGAKTWHLLYQADVRMRGEEMQVIRRNLIVEAEAVRKVGGQHPYDEARPWAMVWARATEEGCGRFWRDEFIDPAQLVRLELKKLGDVVDGDAPIEATDSKNSVLSPGRPAASTLPPAPPQPRIYKRPQKEWQWPLRSQQEAQVALP